MDENKSPRILLFVEDEADIAELYKTAFEEEGFTVEDVRTGKEALEKLNGFTPEDVQKHTVMILDILLPDISGMDVMRETRKHPMFNSVPIIMFTNYSSDEIRAEIEKYPNTKYLLKMDTTPMQLVETVKGMLGASTTAA